MNFQQQFGQSNPLRNQDDKRTDAELFTGIPFIPILSVNENSSRNSNILPFTKNQIIESQNKSSELKKKFENTKQQKPPLPQLPLKSSTSNVLPQFEDDNENGNNNGSQDFNIDFSLDLDPVPLRQQPVQSPPVLATAPPMQSIAIPSFDKLIGSPSQSFNEFYSYLFNRCQEKMRSKDIWNDGVKQLEHFTFESLMKHVIGLSVFLLDPESYNKVNSTIPIVGGMSYDGKLHIKENMNLFTEQRNQNINKISEFLEKKQYAFKRLVDESIYFFQYIDVGILSQQQQESPACKCIFTEETLVPGIDKAYVICVHTLEKEVPKEIEESDGEEDEDEDSDEDNNNSDTDDNNNNNNNEDKGGEVIMKRSLVKPNLPSTPNTASSSSIVHSTTTTITPPGIRYYYVKHYNVKDNNSNNNNNDKLYLKLLISLLQYQTFEMDIMNAINIWKRKKKEQQKRTDFINSNNNSGGNAIKMNVVSTATAATTTENLFHTFLYDEIFEKIIQNQIILDHIVWNWMKSLMM